MTDSSFAQDEKSQAHSGGLDFKRVLSRAIRFWYIVVLCLVVSILIAFYKTRYSQRVFPVTASIMIRETKAAGGAAELLFQNSLIDPYRNYLNEPYIIRSYPLIEKVVQDLNFNASFYREGYFMTTEAYSYMPVSAYWCDPNGIVPGEYIFMLTDENNYSLNVFHGTGETKNPIRYAINDTIQYQTIKVCIKKIPGRSIEPFIGVPFLLVIKNNKAIAESYIKRLNVEWAEEGAGIINLSLTGENTQKEIDFLNGLIVAYRSLDLQNKNEAADRTIDFIRYQLKDIKDSLRIIEYQLERFGNSSRIKDMSAEAQRLFEKAEGFELQKAELLMRQNYYEYLDTYLAKNEGSFDQIVLPSSVGLTDPVLTGLLSKMVDIQQEIKLNIDLERGTNPLVMGKVDRIKEMKKDVLESIKTLRSTDKIKMDFLKSQLSEIERQLTSLPASERQLISVQRNYSLMENLYVFLMQKLSEAGISRASNTSDIIPINPPMQGAAISPKPMQNYVIAISFGLLLPLAFFVLFELINNKVQSKEDVEKMSTIPFIGGVGHNNLGTNLPVNEMPKSGLAESFRALRSNLNFFTGNKARKVFMVTSSISGEGKTFTTSNLATVFALSGKRTLIVGADMRRPKIFQDFNLDNSTGLSTYLSGITEFDQVVQGTHIPNLFLISGGPVPPNPSELLLTSKFEDFVRIAVEKFDFVLIDTPPLALVTDAFVISKFVDHTVFVMRQNFSPKDFIRSIDEYYKTGKIKNISILLNDIYKSGLGYGYGQGYSYQYGYGYSSGYYGPHGGYYSDEKEKKSFFNRLFKK